MAATHTWYHLWHMGGYGAYVWSAYLFVFVVFTYLIVSSRRSLKAALGQQVQPHTITVKTSYASKT